MIKNTISKIKYGVDVDEYDRIMDIASKDRFEAILECKFNGYKRLCQRLQQEI